MTALERLRRWALPVSVGLLVLVIVIGAASLSLGWLAEEEILARPELLARAERILEIAAYALLASVSVILMAGRGHYLQRDDWQHVLLLALVGLFMGGAFYGIMDANFELLGTRSMVAPPRVRLLSDRVVERLHRLPEPITVTCFTDENSVVGYRCAELRRQIQTLSVPVEVQVQLPEQNMELARDVGAVRGQPVVVARSSKGQVVRAADLNITSIIQAIFVAAGDSQDAICLLVETSQDGWVGRALALSRILQPADLLIRGVDEGKLASCNAVVVIVEPGNWTVRHINAACDLLRTARNVLVAVDFRIERESLGCFDDLEFRDDIILQPTAGDGHATDELAIIYSGWPSSGEDDGLPEHILAHRFRGVWAGASWKRVLQSGESAWAEASLDLRREPAYDAETDAYGPIVLAAVREDGSTRQVVIGSTSLVSDSHYLQHQPSAIEFVGTALVWISGSEQTFRERLEQVGDRTLDLTGAQLAISWVISLVVLPAILVAIPLVRFALRLSHRRWKQ